MSDSQPAQENGQVPKTSHAAGVLGVNPHVFVVGCPRSGTTLLQRMLDNHPQLALANDTHFIPRVLEKTMPAAVDDALSGRPVSLTSELVEAVRGYHRFARLDLCDEAVDRAIDRSSTYGELVANLYGELARRDGKPLAGEKTPDYVRRMPLLHALCPQARFVHIYRDGRDVALSLLQWATPTKGPGRFKLWANEPIAVCALWWQWLVSAGRTAGAGLGESLYLEISYEQLVDRSSAMLTRIADFLDLPMTPNMLAYHVGKIRTDKGLSAKKAWLPPTSGLRDWRNQMPPRDVELFEALAGDTLEELGYERSLNDISPEVASTATECRAWWDKDLARRRKSNRTERHADDSGERTTD